MNRDELLVRASISSGLTCGFARFQSNPRVYFHFEINDNSIGELDENRLAVVFLDGMPEIDLCNAKSFGKLIDTTSSQDAFFSSGPFFAGGVIWHGVPKEGMGFFARILNAKTFVLRIYFKDYSVCNFEMQLEILKQIIEQIKNKIFSP